MAAASTAPSGVDMYVRTAAVRAASGAPTCTLILTGGQVVSFEFKYVGPAGIRNPRACASQMGLYVKRARRHAAHHLLGDGGER